MSQYTYGYDGNNSLVSETRTVDGLQYLRSRYYDPYTGVFISADSYRGEFNEPLSQNRYTYAHNNPYKYDDPSGHLPIGGLNKNNVAILGGTTTPTVVTKKKKKEESSASGSSKPKTTPSPDVKPTSTQVYMQEQVSKPTNVQGYDQGTSKKTVDTVPSTQELPLDNRNVNFSDTPTVLDTPANQKVTVEVKETEEVTGKEESSKVGTETTIVTEPYYYSNPFGVNYEEYYRSLGIYNVPDSPYVRNELSIEIQEEDLITIVGYANEGIGLYAEYLETNVDFMKSRIFSHSANSTLANKASETMIGAVDDLGFINDLGGYLISFLSGMSTYFSDIADGKSESQAFGHAIVSEVIPMMTSVTAGVLAKSGVLKGVAVLSSLTPTGAALVVGIGTSFVVNEAYENNWFGFQALVDDISSMIVD